MNLRANSFPLVSLLVSGILASSVSPAAFAGEVSVDPATITVLAVNGGADTANPGVTCLQIAEPLLPSCGGYVAVPNQNKYLIVAAIEAKATNAPVRLYYYGDTGNYHCPGRGFTACSVMSIDLK